MERSRVDPTIETLRGLAVVLMVAGHVVGQGETRGLEAAYGSLPHYLYYCFQYLRLPLFTAIGGFIYAGHRVTSGSGASFLGRKARRLLIPFMAISTLQFLAQ